MILLLYLRGKIQRAMAKGIENIGNLTHEKWKSNDCCTETGLLKTKLHQLIFVNSPTPNAILIKRGKTKISSMIMNTRGKITTQLHQIQI